MNLRHLGIVLLVVAVVFGWGGVWWWALFGMSTEVGNACGTTALVALAGGLLSLMAYDLGRN